MKTLRIIGGNPVYAYGGVLYHRETSQGQAIDHTVTDEVAEVLLNDEYTPWREVAEDGSIIPNEADEFEAAEQAEFDARRTITVDNSTPATGRTERADAQLAKTGVDPAAKPARKGPVEVADVPEAAAENKVTITKKAAKAAAPAEPAAPTEPSVEV